MIVHLALFLCYLVSMTYLYGVNYLSPGHEDAQVNCRYLRAFEVGWYLSTLSNFLIASLFTYISIELS